MPLPDVGKKAMVCLQSWMGTYVCAEGGGGSLVTVNRAEAGGWETFQLSRIDDSKITLRADNGKYVCAEKGKGSVLTASRTEAGPWETFEIYVDKNGLVFLVSDDGRGDFVCADQSGVMVANREKGGGWEAFRMLEPTDANVSQVRVEVNVYKIKAAPFWHTGTAIDGKEYYFNTNNHVDSCDPGKMGLIRHRTLVRIVPGNPTSVKTIREHVIKKWNGTRYDVAAHNCNFFTHDLLRSLGAIGLEQEYLNASGLAKGLRQLPATVAGAPVGGATLQELIVKWPIEDKRLDEAFMEDLRRLARLPRDIDREIKGLGGSISDAWRRI